MRQQIAGFQHQFWQLKLSRLGFKPVKYRFGDASPAGFGFGKHRFDLTIIWPDGQCAAADIARLLAGGKEPNIG